MALENNEDCSIHAKTYMIAYLVIKWFFIASRVVLILVGWISKSAIVFVLILCGLALWVLTTFGFYIAESIAFFSESNDCKVKANNLYVGLFIITAEACVVLSIVLFFGGWAGFVCTTGK